MVVDLAAPGRLLAHTAGPSPRGWRDVYLIAVEQEKTGMRPPARSARAETRDAGQGGRPYASLVGLAAKTDADQPRGPAAGMAGSGFPGSGGKAPGAAAAVAATPASTDPVSADYVAVRGGEPGEGKSGARRAPRVIVIDAGHGGNDPGAVSRAGRQEKDLTLAAALELKQDLERRGDYKVVLTRDRDVYVALADRVAIARAARADLFISLHADSDRTKTAAGASIYTLSDSGGARARSLMDRQNWQVALPERRRSGAVDDILVELTQRETKTASSAFADELADRLRPVTPLAHNNHRSAGFFVLLAPDVPAALLEMGFITHARDETRLSSAPARAAMMEAVAASIDDHFHPATERAYAEAGAGGASFGARAAP